MFGGLATAVLFNIGKSAIAWYITWEGEESTYGAAASVVVLLVWVYYSAQIFLLGAEFTRALDPDAQQTAAEIDGTLSAEVTRGAHS